MGARALVDLLAADVVFTPPPMLAGAFRPYFGRTAVAGWLAAHAPSLTLRPERYVAAGERVVVVGRLSTGDGGDEVECAWLWAVRDGRVAEVRAFRYASEAVARLLAAEPDAG